MTSLVAKRPAYVLKADFNRWERLGASSLRGWFRKEKPLLAQRSLRERDRSPHRKKEKTGQQVSCYNSFRKKCSISDKPCIHGEEALVPFKVKVASFKAKLLAIQ